MVHYYQNNDIERIVRLRMALAHPQEIAEIMGRTKYAIDRILSLEKQRRRLSYPSLPHKDSKWNYARIEDIAQQTRFKKQYEIAAEYSVSASMISQLMIKRATMIREASLCYD